MAPLIIQSPSIDKFPPNVVYQHETSISVAILFKDNGPHWKQNDVLGSFLLAGHGVGPTVVGNPAAFTATVLNQPNPAPVLCPPCEKKDGGPTLISFAVLAGLAALLGVVMFIWRRRWSENYSA